MKKLIAFFLIILFLNININAAQKDMTKLVGGLTLTGIGSILIYWGFSFKSTSIAEITMQSFTWNKNYNTSWEEDYNGTIKNSGNTDLSNIKLHITFKDINYNYISQQTIAGPDTLKTGQIYSFSDSYDTGTIEPGFVSVSYSASFMEDLETRDLYIGISGIAVAAAGLFFIADYIFDFTGSLEQKSISINLIPDYSGIKMYAYKKF